MTEIIDSPTTASSAATDTTAVPSLDSIVSKMTAMKEMTLRNQMRATEEAAPGEDVEAKTSTPVAPDEPKITSADDANIDRIEDTDPPEEAEAADSEVSDSENSNSTSEELIDFIDFAETNPQAKFKFMRNGKEVIIDAKKAAAILGQGGAIHEEARQLKIERAEFDEYLREQRAQQEGLSLAMEFTIQPQIQRAYDEIIKTQGYQNTFQQQLARTQDSAEQARIRANIQQNERYIQSQSQLVNRLKPNLEEFRNIRRQQVSEVLESNRKSFTDKELKNEFLYSELRDKLAKTWAGANSELVPGIKNLDLISSDETILSLIRDGLKFRDRPRAQSAGSSIAQLTPRRAGSVPNSRSQEDQINRLREQAKAGDKKAGDNLLVAQLAKLRAARK